jgi:spermidine synthase
MERDRFLPLLIVLFAGSGAAALIYEIVWFQLLQLVIGSTAVSLAVLLGTFMGGMCLGSLASPRIISPRHHPLHVYAVLELGIAVIGLLVLFGISHIGGLYTVILLLPPTILMGATLPAVARWVEANPRGISWLGFFYTGNIAGAVFGCLWAGFYLLRVYDTSVATYVAATLNVFVAATAFLMARKGMRAVEKAPVETAAVAIAPGAWTIYAAIGLSGLAALGAEAVWTRVLSLMLGASTYTFSIILAVFLVGLGLGSSAGSVLARRSADPRRDLGICQLLAVAGIAWSAYMLAASLPYWPIDPALSRSPWFDFQLDLFRSTWAVLPAAFFWGASFPLALAAIARRGQDTGRLVGGVYAANTIGAIIGAVCFSVVFIQWFGTHHAQHALIGISTAAAVLAMRKRLSSIVTVAVVGAVLMFTVAPLPGGLIAYGRFLAWNLSNNDPVTQDYFVPNILYVGEGMNASVAVSETSIGIRNFHVSGKIEASNSRRDMRLQRMLGHLPGLLHPRPRSVLIVGLGAGVTAGSFINHPSVERIVICEIEPLIAREVSKYFATQNNNVIEDPRVEIVYDDARHYLLTTGERFDIITSDPIHPWVKGAAALYTREYFELVQRHLNPGGIVSQWVPLYQSSMDTVKSEFATFFEIFSGGSVWSNDVGGKGYDIVLLGRDSSSPINVDEVEQRLNRRDHVNVLRSVKELGFESAVDLLATYAGQHADLAPWLDGSEINRDRNLRLQYLAGMGVNLAQEAVIYDSMLAYRGPPEKLFAGSPELMADLKGAIDRRRPRVLSENQAAAISKALSARPAGRISVSVVLGDSEALQYATELREAIVAGGWQVSRLRQSLFTQQFAGLLIFVGSDPPPANANALFQSLRAAGLTVEGNVDPAAKPDSVSLVVGAQR